MNKYIGTGVCPVVYLLTSNVWNYQGSVSTWHYLCGKFDRPIYFEARFTDSGIPEDTLGLLYDYGITDSEIEDLFKERKKEEIISENAGDVKNEEIDHKLEKNSDSSDKNGNMTFTPIRRKKEENEKRKKKILTMVLIRSKL